MSKYISGIFAVLVLLWVAYFLAASTQVERIRRFCSPVTYVAQIGGSAVGVADEQSGKDFAEEGATILNTGCGRFAPSFLKIFGVYNEKQAQTEFKEIMLKRLSEQKQAVETNLEKLLSSEARQHFSPDQLRMLEEELRRELSEIEEQIKSVQEGASLPVDGILEKDKL